MFNLIQDPTLLLRSLAEAPTLFRSIERQYLPEAFEWQQHLKGVGTRIRLCTQCDQHTMDPWCKHCEPPIHCDLHEWKPHFRPTRHAAFDNSCCRVLGFAGRYKAVALPKHGGRALQHTMSVKTIARRRVSVRDT